MWWKEYCLHLWRRRRRKLLCSATCLIRMHDKRIYRVEPRRVCTFEYDHKGQPHRWDEAGPAVDHPKPVARKKIRGEVNSGPSRNYDKTTIGLSTTCLPAAPTKKAVVKVWVCILQAYHKVFTSHPDSPNRLRKHVFPIRTFFALFGKEGGHILMTEMIEVRLWGTFHDSLRGQFEVSRKAPGC